MPTPTATGNLDDNVNWRKQWWEAIVTQTWRETPWFGVGFGTHLAHAFGFTKIPDDSVRSPHSIHITWLARGGLVGLGLWMLVNILWIGSVWAARRRFVAAGLMTPAHLSTWCMCVWVAMGLNASFDIYLEGPAGGIWYWSLIGLGLFLIVLSRPVQAAEDRSLNSPLAKGST